MTAQSEQETRIVANYLRERKVLIADPSAGSRSGLFSILHELGVATANLTLVKTFEHAQEAVAQLKPHVVITEYELGKRCGLELLLSQREQRPQETKECLFAVVTGNTSQTAVARAAEEDIDAYILKPYTQDSVRKALLATIIRKIKPPEYYLAIEAGKKLIAEGKLDEAEKEFGRAGGLDPAPSLACFYLGQIKIMRKLLEESQGSYEKGLAFNRIHYKCLVGLYELQMEQKHHREAYEVVKRISQYFPANPKRLTEVLRLAVLTAQYEDIEKYYSVFTNIDERNETLVRYICAALVVCGKYYLSTNLGNSRALELFRKAAVTSQGRANVLKEIVFSLLEYGLTKDTYPFMERFPPESINTVDFQFLRFLVTDAEGKVAAAINQGRALLARGVIDERLYTALIKRGVETKLSQLAIDEILHHIATHLPDKKAHFEELLKSTRAKLPTPPAS